MKKLIHFTIGRLFSAFVCGVLAIGLVLLPGCAGTPKTVAYKSLKSVSDAVDGAMKAAAEAHASGVIDVPTWNKIKVRHEQYRVPFNKAVVAARFDYESASPAEVAGLAAELTALIASYVR